MNFEYTDEQKAIRAEIEAFCKEHINPGAAERDQTREFPRQLFEKIGQELKLQGLAVPEELGGRGLDPLTTATALEAFGYACDDSGFVFSVCAHLLASSVPLAKFATDEQQAKLFPGFCDGSVVGINGMTEPGAGSDIGSLETTAVRDGDGWVIKGHKALATNGPAGDMAVVFAVTDPEAGLASRMTPFLVPATAEGFSKLDAYRTLGQRTTTLGEIVLENVRVSSDDVLGGHVGTGMAIFNHAMNWERTCLFAAHAGQMRRLTEIGVARAKTRKQFGKAIGSFQGISHRVANMKIRTDASRLLAYHAASRLDKARDVALDASVVKTFVGEAWVQTTQDLLQIHGGAGYCEHTGIERHVRDSMSATLYSGTSEIQRNIIAAWLGLPL